MKDSFFFDNRIYTQRFQTLVKFRHDLNPRVPGKSSDSNTGTHFNHRLRCILQPILYAGRLYLSYIWFRFQVELVSGK